MTQEDRTADTVDHYTEGRRYSYISHAWILEAGWNDREEAAMHKAHYEGARAENVRLRADLDKALANHTADLSAEPLKVQSIEILAEPEPTEPCEVMHDGTVKYTDERVPLLLEARDRVAARACKSGSCCMGARDLMKRIDAALSKPNPDRPRHINLSGICAPGCPACEFDRVQSETNDIRMPTPEKGNGETVGRAIAETTRTLSDTNSDDWCYEHGYREHKRDSPACERAKLSQNTANETTGIRHEDIVDSENWCPQCSHPRGACTCEQLNTEGSQS